MPYKKPDGLSHSEITSLLKKVYNDYPEYSDPEHNDGKTFHDMVELFAENDFYHYHLIAQAYLETEKWLDE